MCIIWYLILLGHREANHLYQHCDVIPIWPLLKARQDLDAAHGSYWCSGKQNQMALRQPGTSMPWATPINYPVRFHGNNSQCFCMMCAVSFARPKSDDTMTSNFHFSRFNLRPTASAWALPSFVSGESNCPWYLRKHGFISVFVLCRWEAQL